MPLEYLLNKVDRRDEQDYLGIYSIDKSLEMTPEGSYTLRREGGEEIFILRIIPEIGGGPPRIELIPVGTALVTTPLGQNILVGELEAPCGAGIRVTWDDHSFDEDGFRVYYGTDGVTFPNVVGTGPNIQTVDICNLVDGQQYYFYVVAFNEAGEGNPTTIETAYAGTQPPAQIFVIKQNFETPVTGYDNGETWLAGGAGGTVDPAYTGIVLKETQSLRIRYSGGAGYEYLYKAFAPLSECWAHSRIHCANLSGGDGGTFQLSGAVSYVSVDMGVTSGGQHRVRMNTSGGFGPDSAKQYLYGQNLYLWMHYKRNDTGALWVGTSATRPPSVDGGASSYLTFTCPDEDASLVLLSNNLHASFGDFIFDNILVSPTEIGDDPNPF